NLHNHSLAFACPMCRKQGVEVTRTKETVEVVYSGDTVMSALLPVEEVWQARLLIMEVTYLEGSTSDAAKHQHIHVQDILDNVSRFSDTEQLVIAHVSERHGHHRNILRTLANTLPAKLINKVHIILLHLPHFGI
ncbi:unnamed protein product, partial [Choristocarpus tenellus]